MNKWIQVILAVVILTAIIWGQEYLKVFRHPVLSSPEIVIMEVPESPSKSQSNPSQSLAINPDQLWEHLQVLAGERYNQTDRSHTRDYLVQELQNLGFSPTRHPYEGDGVNIIGEHPGTNPTAGTILVAAHYDTVPNSPGADDNASGIATALEIARIFSSVSTVRTLKIAFFDQEELGLLGSLAFTSDPQHLSNLKAAIILDMVGYACHTPGCQQYPEGLAVESWLQTAGVSHPDRGEFIAVVGDAEHLPLIQVFSNINHNRQDNLPPMVTIPIPLKGLLTPDVLRSDHAAFWYHNIGAVLVSDTANFRSPHYHQPTDTLETLDRVFLQGVAQQVVNVISQLLDSQESYDIKSS